MCFFTAAASGVFVVLAGAGDASPFSAPHRETTPSTSSIPSRRFAVLHDSRRVNEVTDPEHGPRAAEFAGKLRGTVFDLDDREFDLLYRACEGHTHERNHPDVTIQTCWDSDRLDLGRVGITPHPSRLCTEVAKRPETIKWADGRASVGVVPNFVLEDWGIDLETERSW